MKRSILSAIGGLALGVLIAGIAFWSSMPSMMLSIHESKYDFDMTVSKLEGSIKAHGWLLPKMYNLQASLQKAGYDDMTKMTIFSLCQPEHAYKILSPDADKQVSSIMPCRISVYENHCGNVFIAGMNLGLMSKMFGGNIKKVMSIVAAEEHGILENIVLN